MHPLCRCCTRGRTHARLCIDATAHNATKCHEAASATVTQSVHGIKQKPVTNGKKAQRTKPLRQLSATTGA